MPSVGQSESMLFMESKIYYPRLPFATDLLPTKDNWDYLLVFQVRIQEIQYGLHFFCTYTLFKYVMISRWTFDYKVC